MTKYAILTFPPSNPPIVTFYEARNFAYSLFGKLAGGNVPYYYFKFRRINKFKESFEKLSKFGERTIFLSQDDVVVWIGCSNYIHVWDAKKKQPLPGKPEGFLAEKNKFLNWFKQVFPIQN